MDLKEETLAELLQVFTRPHLPITVKSAGNQGDVDRWPQLVGIKISKINENVGLLIWNNAHEILQPKEVRESCHNGPYATQMVLGHQTRWPVPKVLQHGVQLHCLW